MYISDKKEKELNNKLSAIDKYVNENNTDKALEITLSLPDTYSLKDYTIMDISVKVAESAVTKALEITQVIKDSNIQSYTLKNIAEQVALNSVNEALKIVELIKDETIKDKALKNITDIKKTDNR
jgi:outer membrane PBP1 activator LpoA protein